MQAYVTEDERRAQQMRDGQMIDKAEYAWMERGGDVTDAVYAGRPAWHERGRVWELGKKGEDEGIPFDEAMEDPAANFEVELRRLGVPANSTGLDVEGDTMYGEFKLYDDKYGVVRKDNGARLGVVGKVYEVRQNRECFGWLERLVDSGDLRIEAVVAMKGGALISIEARRPDHVLIGGEEVIPYIAAVTSHDGTWPTSLVCTEERFVCRNTVRIGLKKARHKYTVRHTRYSDIKLEEARKILEVSFRYTEALKEFGDELLGVKVNATGFDRFVEKLIPVAEPQKDATGKITNQRGITIALRKQEELRETYMTSDNLGNIRGTGWGVFNAVAEWQDHVRNWRNRDVRGQNVLNGNPVKEQAAGMLLEMAR